MESTETLTKTNPKTTYLKDYKIPPFLIETVNLEFNLNETKTLVKSTMVVSQNPKSDPHHNLILQGEALKLLSVKLNNKLLDTKDYELTDKLLILYDVPAQFDLEIQTEINPLKNTALSGLYVSNNNFCTQCESEGFRRITYFLDRPDVMARYSVTIIAKEKNYPILLSNGNKVGSGKLDEGRHFVKWEDPFKKPSYLFALVAGDFDVLNDEFITDSRRKVTLQIFVEKGNKDKAQFAMQAVKKAMRWDEEAFGREYDLDIYMIVAVSDFNFGAMENKGLNIFNTKYILANPATATDQDYLHIESVIAHEYCHNWSGNRITCRDWFQLSLKEGLTIFRDQSFTADTTSKTVARIQDVSALRNAQFPEDAGPLAHSVQPDSYMEINNFYTSTIYNKGAEVIRMMQTILGTSLFRKGMDLYFQRNDGHAVTIEEFVRAMEDASSMDLKQFRLWYSQAGTPILTITDNYNPSEQIYRLTITQSCPSTPGQAKKLPMDIPVKIGLLNPEGKEVANDLLRVQKETETFEFKNMKEKPIPSLLRGFSAPVKVDYDYDDKMLLFLFENDTDPFNAWEAGQQFALRLILKSEGTPKIPKTYFSALKNVIEKMQDDKLLLAQMLTLPSENYIAEQMKTIDMDRIHAAREFILLEIATHLKNDFLGLYKKSSRMEIADRALKNVSLTYLMLLPDYKAMGVAQFKDSIAKNMTDTLAALKSLSNLEVPERAQVLDEFYTTFKDDALVVDKWFSVQAISKLPNTLEEVKKLTQHPAFDFKNPNKVYALIVAFTHQNLVRFHNLNGEGYSFLGDMILKVDAINPHVAARLVRPFTAFKQYDKTRQVLMKAQLERILATASLSDNVYELVEKSLGV